MGGAEAAVGIVGAVMAVVAPVAVLIAQRRVRDIKDELKTVSEEVLSPNGQRTGETVHAILVAVENQTALLRAHIQAPPEVAHGRLPELQRIDVVDRSPDWEGDA